MEESQEEKKEEILEIEENSDGLNDGIKISNDVDPKLLSQILKAVTETC